MRDNGDVDMYVQVIRDLIDPKRGILRVTGLAFAQVIDERTLLFYYGGTAGDGNTVKKEFMWSEPAARRTKMDVDTVIGDGAKY